MSLPKLYYSISELAERWGVRQSDVIEHIVTGSLFPSVFVENVECIYFTDQEHDSIQQLSVSGEIQFSPPVTLLTNETFLVSCGIYFGNPIFIGGAQDSKIQAQQALHFKEPQKFSVGDIRLRAAPYVAIYEEHVLNKRGGASDDTYVRNLERAIVALAHALKDDKPKFKYGENPNLSQISKFAVEHLADKEGRYPHGWTDSNIKKTLEAALKNCQLPE
jgi:hypothetical protein